MEVGGGGGAAWNWSRGAEGGWVCAAGRFVVWGWDAGTTGLVTRGPTGLGMGFLR